jgi:glycosyltransferase involved in cell wall biosynthesis
VQIDVIGEIRDEKLRSSLQSLPNIKLYGLLPFNQAMVLLGQANLICVMYDISTEVAVVSSANKMFEAMMQSRPYVASKKGYPGIIAEKYSLGWAVPYGDSRALIDLVSELIACPSKIEEAARNARKTYEEHFTWDKQKANLLSLYNCLSDGENIRYFSHAGWDKMVGTVLKC